MSEIKLHDFWRSSAAYRLRIALNLKGLDYSSTPVNIAPGADEQFRDGYRALNPQMRVPTLEVDGRRSGQSMAILEWLDETYPEPPLLPSGPWARLEVRAFPNPRGRRQITHTANLQRHALVAWAALIHQADDQSPAVEAALSGDSSWNTAPSV